jgi:cell division protein FtsZ
MSEQDLNLGELADLKMKVIGIGGAGNNAVDRLQMAQRLNLPLANVNTDCRTLNASPLAEKVLLGRKTTGGLSAGYDADVGKAAAEESAAEIQAMLEGQDLVFLVAGLGGGTGSGAAPVVAEIASELGAVVIAFVTLPLSREGARMAKRSEDALCALREVCHAVIPLPNDVLLQEIDEKATVLDAFQLADDWIGRGVKAISSMLSEDGLMNVDFAKLRKAFSYQGGKTLFGFAEAEGPDAVEEALRNFDLCPLLHLPENRYTRETDSLILYVSGGPDLEMAKVSKIVEFVTERFRSREETVLGASIEGSMSGKVSITVIGNTALDRTRHYVKRPRRSLVRQPLLEEAKPEVEPLAEAEAKAATPEAITPAPVAEAPAPEAPPVAATPASSWTKPKGFLRRSKDPRDQEEFNFPTAEENRGYFDKTEANLYEGADLDVPTYLRRGLKISLSVS